MLHYSRLFGMPVHCLFTACSLPTHCLHTAYALPTHCLLTAYSLPTHCLPTAYPLPTHCSLPAHCSLPTHCLLTAYSFPTHSAKPKHKKRHNPLDPLRKQPRYVECCIDSLHWLSAVPSLCSAVSLFHNCQHAKLMPDPFVFLSGQPKNKRCHNVLKSKPRSEHIYDSLRPSYLR
jgi:hypothetical protein